VLNFTPDFQALWKFLYGRQPGKLWALGAWSRLVPLQSMFHCTVLARGSLVVDQTVFGKSSTLLQTSSMCVRCQVHELVAWVPVLLSSMCPCSGMC
jgi:hypothetical protein